MLFPDQLGVRKELSLYDAMVIVTESANNGKCSSVAEAIDELSTLTGKTRFSNDIYKRLGEIIND